MLLQTQHLMKAYGTHQAVNDLNLTIQAGSFTAILGPNGAGKSTTIGMVLGQLKPTAGTITYQPHLKIGVVFQNSVLDALLTVQENLNIRAQQYRRIPTNRITTLATQLGLTAFLNQRYGTLSGGQKRRVDIARALLNQPDLLFLDEPTTGLDLQTRQAIWTLLQHLQEQQHLTIVLTTHYLDEADTADQVYIVDHGHVIAQGTATAIKAQYAPHQLVLMSADLPQLQQALAQENVTVLPDSLHLQPANAQAALTLLTTYQDLISNFEFRPGTMDDAFLALTGKEVR